MVLNAAPFRVLWRGLLLNLAAGLVLGPLSAHAEPPAGGSTILPQGEVLKQTPAGRETVRIQREARGQISQRIGDWVKVELEGYVWRAHTEDFLDPASQAAQDLPPLPLQLRDYQIRWQPQDFHAEGAGRAQIVAELTFRNNRPESVSCLDYSLRLYNLKGQLLHEEAVTCDQDTGTIDGRDYRQVLRWQDYGGPQGDVFRRLAPYARNHTLRIDLGLHQAIYADGSVVDFTRLLGAPDE